MEAWVIPIGVAAASLIVVPACVTLGKILYRHWSEASRARLFRLLDDRYTTQEEHEMHFETLSSTQAQQHRQNHDFLDTIRTEAHTREGKILGSIEAVANQNRQEATRLGQALDSVSKRVDRLFELKAVGKEQ